MRRLLIVLITGLYLLCLVCFSRILTADLNYIKSKDYLKTGKLEKSLNIINISIQKNPYEPRYRYEKAKILLALDKNLEAVKSLEKAQELNKNNLVTSRNMIPIYSFTSKDLAKEYYEKLKNKYPNDAGLLVQIAEYEKSLSLAENYNQTANMIKKLRPDLLDWAL